LQRATKRSREERIHPPLVRNYVFSAQLSQSAGHARIEEVLGPDRDGIGILRLYGFYSIEEEKKKAYYTTRPINRREKPSPLPTAS
jgi:hypothetical protein